MITVKKNQTQWEVSFWEGNDIKKFIVFASSHDEAIYNACEKTHLRMIANVKEIK